MPPFKLPPNIQSKVDEYLPQVKAALEPMAEVLGPLFKTLAQNLKNLTTKVAHVAPSSSLGGTFRHICVVGLNRAELLLQGETQSVFGDGWQDMADTSYKRHMGLVFFAPRGLDGLPVNPYLFLMGEMPTAKEGEESLNSMALAEQAVGNMPLLDFCRMSPASPNSVNIILAADMLFHWDVKDNYILPTTPTSWVRDVEQVLKSYPRTTKAHIYTQWDTEILPPTDRVKISSLRDIPLDDATWLNQPTIQEKYANHVLVVGLILAGLVFAGLWAKQNGVDELAEQLNVTEQQIPRGGQLSDLQKAVTEQEKMFDKRELFNLVVKDVARAIQKSGMEVQTFEVKVPEQNEAPRQYLVTIDAKAGIYQGWLQEEPIARAVLLNSTVLDALRKPPTSSGFKLEGLVDSANLLKKYNKIEKAAPVADPSKTEAGVEDEETSQ